MSKLSHLTGLACALAGAGALGVACTTKSGPAPGGADFDASSPDATFASDGGVEGGDEIVPASTPR